MIICPKRKRKVNRKIHHLSHTMEKIKGMWILGAGFFCRGTRIFVSGISWVTAKTMKLRGTVLFGLFRIRQLDLDLSQELRTQKLVT
jgi:hypothetical protein